MQVQSLGWEDTLEEGMATHSSTLAWRIPWTEESGGLHSMGLQRFRHDSRDLAAPTHCILNDVNHGFDTANLNAPNNTALLPVEKQTIVTMSERKQQLA